VLNLRLKPTNLTWPRRFRAVGYGTAPVFWKSIVKAYMDVGSKAFSVLKMRTILAGEVGVERAAYVLKNVRKELLGE